MYLLPLLGYNLLSYQNAFSRDSAWPYKWRKTATNLNIHELAPVFMTEEIKEPHEEQAPQAIKPETTPETQKKPLAGPLQWNFPK